MAENASYRIHIEAFGSNALMRAGEIKELQDTGMLKGGVIGAVTLVVLVTIAMCAAATAHAAAPALALLPAVKALFSGAYEPGPSAALWTTPYYVCRTNYYVSTVGNDGNAGTATSPWLTLQHANNSLPTNFSAAGTCINVEPGNYSKGAQLRTPFKTSDTKLLGISTNMQGL